MRSDLPTGTVTFLGDSVFAEAWAQVMDLAFDEAAALALRESDVDA